MRLMSERLQEKLEDWALDYVPGPIYRIPSKIMDTYREVKWFFQRLQRPHHSSDRDLWNLNNHLADIILPKLKAFKRMPRMGYPADFCEYDDEHPGPWASKEEYDKEIEKGTLVGGGPEAWEAALDEMIFAFELFKADESEKHYKKFVKKYGYDWHAKTPENKIVNIWYRNPETGRSMMTSEDDPPGPPWVKDDEIFNGIFRKPFYYNSKLHMEAWTRARKGFELFGKYFGALWD